MLCHIYPQPLTRAEDSIIVTINNFQYWLSLINFQHPYILHPDLPCIFLSAFHQDIPCLISVRKSRSEIYKSRILSVVELLVNGVLGIAANAFPPSLIPGLFWVRRCTSRKGNNNNMALASLSRKTGYCAVALGIYSIGGVITCLPTFLWKIELAL